MTNDGTGKSAEFALNYLALGLKLVVMPSGTKGPNTAGWNELDRLVTEPSQIIDRLARGPCNMGVVHEHSGTVALDIDDEAFTRAIWDEFGLDYDTILDGGCRIWSKENRGKVIYRMPAGVELPLLKVNWPKKNATKPNELITVFELRAGANQDVLPPSVHPDGHNYLWFPGRAPWDLGDIPILPQSVVSFWLALADRKHSLKDSIQAMCPWRVQAATRRPQIKTRQVSGEHSDVIGQFNQANHVGDLLEEYGYKRKGRRYLAPSSSTGIPGVNVLDDKCFSHHASDIINDGYAHDAFDLLVTLGHGGDFSSAIKDAANRMGIERRTAQPLPPQIDLEAVLAGLAKRKAAMAAEAAGPVQIQSEPAQAASEAHASQAQVAHARAIPGSTSAGHGLPEHLLKPPGIFGDTVAWMVRDAPYPQPELAVAAALAMFSCVLGQKVANYSGLRTNLYLAGIAGTAAGKEFGRKCATAAMHAGGMAPAIGGNKIASGSALLSHMESPSKRVYFMDEFAKVLRSWLSPKAPAHLAEIPDQMLDLFSKADQIVPGVERADKKNNATKTINYPCLSFYGTCTGEIWDVLTGGDISSGLINRFLIVTATHEPAYQRPRPVVVPEHISAWISAAQMMNKRVDGNPDTGGLEAVHPLIVADSKMADTIYEQFRAWSVARARQLDGEPGGLGPLWGRAHELAMRVGLILSVTRIKDPQELLDAANRNGLEVDHASAVWAVEFVRHCLTQTENEVRNRMGENPFDRLVSRVSKLIDDAGPEGLTTRRLCERSREFRAFEFKDRILAELRTRGVAKLVEEKNQSNGKVRRTWISGPSEDE